MDFAIVLIGILFLLAITYPFWIPFWNSAQKPLLSSQTVSQKFCQNCGVALPLQKANFCPNCGTKLLNP